LGDAVRSFEAGFSRFCEAERGVGVANGTDALEIALRAAGCGPGTEVIVSGNSGGYSSIASILVGATPVIVDVLANNGLIDQQLALQAVTPRTRAVVVTHLYGQAVDTTVLRLKLPEYVSIIEDAAQAHGARCDSGMVGSLGDLSCFSFYPTKNLGALGDGGFVTGRNVNLVELVREMAQYGWSSRYNIARSGGRNSRLDEIQAAILSEELIWLEHRNDIRIKNASYISSQVAKEFRVTPTIGLSDHSKNYVAHLCVLRSPRRDEIIRELANHGIMTAIHYPIPDHKQLGIRNLIREGSPLKSTEALCNEVMSVPSHPELSHSELQHIADTVKQLW